MHILSNCIQNEQICERRWITYRAEQEEPAAVFQKRAAVVCWVLAPFPAYPQAQTLNQHDYQHTNSARELDLHICFFAK